MIVVADSGPLINLARIHRLDLLQYLYGEVLIPAQVHEEVVVRGTGLPASAEVAAATWFHIITPTIDIAAARAAHPHLGAGEVAAIQHAQSLHADVLLCDDLAARRVAGKLGQRVVGTLGVLVVAKQRGHLPLVGGAIAELLRSGMWLDPAVAREALRLAAGATL